MHQVEIDIRTALVELHRQQAIKLLETTQEILRKKQDSQSESEKNLLWGLFQQVAREVENEQKAMMEWAMESPLIKITPIPLSVLH